MNKLMMMLMHGTMPRYMAEAGSDGGGSAAPGGEGAAPGGGSAAPGGEGAAPGGEGAASEVTSALGKKSAQPTGENPAAQPPAPVSDEDFLKAIVADEATKKLAGNDAVVIAPEVAKKMLPVFREAGLTPENASKLANAYAREQIAQAKAYREQRVASIKEMNDAALKAYPNEADWKTMARARDYFFKPPKDGKGGTMLYTIAHSELGSDPEFLALLKFAGEKLGPDTTPTGGAAGAGDGKVSFAKALGFK